MERVGAALVAPRVALTAAGHPDAAGRASADATLLIVASLLALHTVGVVSSIWIGVADSLGAGLSALLGLVGRAVGRDLVLLVVAGAAVTAFAGTRRAPARDFDLACVAYVPYVLVGLVAELAFSLGATRTRAATDVAGMVAYAWAGLVVVLAIGQARRP
jgi:hypothetical protein